MFETKTIIDRCNLKGLTDSAEGWRAETPFSPPPDAKKSLAISRDGCWFCHKTQKGGHVVELYANMTGTRTALARMQLIREGVLPRGFELNDTPEKEAEKKVEVGKVNSVVEAMQCDGVDWAKASEWRGIPVEVFQEASSFRTFGWVGSLGAGVGSSYVFASQSPPMDGVSQEHRSAMVRSAIPENKDWKSFGSYPIWVPHWNRGATEVWMVEGQWDALALRTAIMAYGTDELNKRVQVMALCGPKNLEKHSEILEYFNLKTVKIIPDADEAGEKILVNTMTALQQVDCKVQLLRLPKSIRSTCKDFNDWWKKGIVELEFSDWTACSEDFRLSNGYVLDSDYCEKHGIRFDGLYEADEEGKPIEIVGARLKPGEMISNHELVLMAKPFPILWNYLKTCEKISEAPPLWHMMSFLTHFAAVIGRRFSFESGLYPNLFTVLVGSSGLGKSQSMMMPHDSSAKSCTDLFCSDLFSVESLFDQFQKANQKMIISHELSEWLSNNENSYRHFALKGFIKMYDMHHYSPERPFKVQFRTKGSSAVIEEPALSILSGCTEHQLITTQDNLRGGLVGRFLFAMGTGYQADIEIPRPLPDEERGQITAFFGSVAATPIRRGMNMKFSDAAEVIFRKAFKTHREHEKKREFSGDILTYTSRWRVQVIKIAMLLELLREQHLWPAPRNDILISDEAMIVSIKLCGVLFDSFMHLFHEQFMRSDAPSRDFKIQQRILKCIAENSSKEGVSKTTIYKFIQERGMTVEDNLLALINAGRIIEKRFKIRGARGRPRVVYYLTKQPQTKVAEEPTRIIKTDVIEKPKPEPKPEPKKEPEPIEEETNDEPPMFEPS